MRFARALVVLAAIAAASNASAANWLLGASCSATAPIVTTIGQGGVYTWCPTTDANSSVIDVKDPVYCSWDDGGGGASLSIIDNVSGVEFMNIPADVSCRASTVEECSAFVLLAGQQVYFDPSAGDAEAKVTCKSTEAP